MAHRAGSLPPRRLQTALQPLAEGPVPSPSTVPPHEWRQPSQPHPRPSHPPWGSCNHCPSACAPPAQGGPSSPRRHMHPPPLPSAALSRCPALPCTLRQWMPVLSSSYVHAAPGAQNWRTRSHCCARKPRARFHEAARQLLSARPDHLCSGWQMPCLIYIVTQSRWTEGHRVAEM